MPHSFVATTYDIPMHDAFNQFADSAEADLNSSTMKGKCPQTVVILFFFFLPLKSTRRVYRYLVTRILLTHC